MTVEGVADAGSDDAMTAQGMVTVTTHAARLFMPLAELVDLEKEKARIEKELKKNRAELDKLEAKLGNPGFVNKAPAHVVEAEQDRAEKLRALLAKTGGIRRFHGVNRIKTEKCRRPLRQAAFSARFCCFL